MPRRSTVAALALVVALATGCNDDGRDLAPAPTVPISRETVPPDSSVAVAALSLTSGVVTPDGLLPAEFTCDGADIVPELAITGVPAGAAELALTVVDLDAEGYVHLAASGLVPNLSRIGSGALPPDADYATTDGGIQGWQGPCPPEGDDAHRYQFTVWVLAEPLGMTPGLSGREAVALIESAAIDSAVLEVRYARASAG